MGLLNILFIATILTFPLGQLIRLQLSGNVNISLFDVTVLVTGIGWLFLVFWGKSSYKRYSLTAPLLLFFLTILLSLIANLFRYQLSDLMVAALYAVRWFLFVCLYFVVMDSGPTVVRKLPDFLTISGTAVLVTGYIQYFFYGNLRNLFYLGWDDHLYRMFSSFLDPNFVGAFFVLFFLFLLGRLTGLYSSNENKLKTGKEKNSSHFVRMILYTILSFTTFLAIFLSTSRSAFLMLVVGLTTYLFLIGKKRWLIGFVIIVAAIIFTASRFYPIFTTENLNPFRSASSHARIESARNALAIIQKNAFFGVGFNAYRYAQQEYGFRKLETLYPSHADSGTDNSFLFVFATTGIIGLTAYIYLLYMIILLGRRRQETVMGKVLIASLVGLFVDSLFINSFFYPAILYWVVVLAGITDYT